jgi:hypothetical protein
MAIEDPNCTKSNTAIAEPKRAKLLMEIEDPKCVNSITDNENTEPNLAMPKRETVEPSRP